MQVLTLRSLYTHGLLNIPYQEEYAKAEPGTKLVYIDDAEDEPHEEIATLESTQRDVEKDDIVYTVRIARVATDHDLQLFESYQEQSDKSLRKFQEVSKKHELPMHGLRATHSLAGDRIYFIFVAEDRVDFREFVKDIARSLKKKVHLRQIGPRDRARLIDGYGHCGRRCCCNQFLVNLATVNMDTARIQGMVGKGSTKLLGSCGKLLCCLNYEVDQYAELSKNFPAEGQTVTIKKKKAPATVIYRDLLNGQLKVIDESHKIHYLDLDEVTFRKNPKTASSPESSTDTSSQS